VFTDKQKEKLISHHQSKFFFSNTEIFLTVKAINFI